MSIDLIVLSLILTIGVVLFIAGMLYIFSLSNRSCTKLFGEQHNFDFSEDKQSTICKDCGLKIVAVKRWRIER